MLSKTCIAEEVIRRWLRDVDSESTMSTDSAVSHYGHSSTSAAEDGDFLSSLDWGNSSVVDSAKSVVEGLMRKKLLNLGHLTESSRSHDPRISMEMRHKQVHNE